MIAGLMRSMGEISSKADVENELKNVEDGKSLLIFWKFA